MGVGFLEIYKLKSNYCYGRKETGLDFFLYSLELSLRKW